MRTLSRKPERFHQSAKKTMEVPLPDVARGRVAPGDLFVQADDLERVRDGRETVLKARVPRVHCPQHGIKRVAAPWGGKHSRFRWLFEAFALRVFEASTTLKAAAPQARIIHDKFHVAKHLNEAVDEVRREHRQLCAEGQDQLTGTKYLWLRNPEHWSPGQQTLFAQLRQGGFKVAKAWQIKELFREVWRCRDAEEALAEEA